MIGRFVKRGVCARSGKLKKVSGSQGQRLLGKSLSWTRLDQPRRMLWGKRKVFSVSPGKYYPLSHPATIIAGQYMERALFSIPFQSPDGTISFETANDQPISISIPFSETLPLPHLRFHHVDLFLLAIYGR